MNYIQVEEHKWYHFTREDGLICCHCSLVHNLKFKIENGKIYIKFKVNDKETALRRRGKENIKTLKKIVKNLWQTNA